MGGLSKPCQQLMDDLGDEALIMRQFDVLNVVGIDAKNTYHYFPDKAIEPVLQGVTGTANTTPIAITLEESGTCERLCLGGGRSLTFTTHLGSTGPAKASDTKDVAFKVRKKTHYPCLPLCSRPSAEVLDANGTLLGTFDNPCMFNCTVKNELYDHQGAMRFQTVTNICQQGTLCPCCADEGTDIQTNTGKSVGQVTRVQMSVGEVFSNVSKQRIKFPKAFDSVDKVLLLAGMTLRDAVYNDNGGAMRR